MGLEIGNAKTEFIWSLIERFSVQGIQFILSLVIARLVTPADFGLIAMTAIFMAIAQVFIDSGFGAALIQKKDRTNVDYSTVFFFNTVIAIIIYCILYASAPLISDFYNLGELTDVIRVLALNLIISSFSIVQRSKLNIALNFKLLAKVSLIAVIIGGVAGTLLAYYGYGVWALVAQTLTTNSITTILLWCTTKWHPSLVFSTESFKQLFSFGSKLLIADILHTFYINLYSLVIGKRYNATDTGLYNRASTISQYPVLNLVQILIRVTYPIQCEHQNDIAWLENSFPKLLRMYVFIIFPIALLICILAKPLVIVILSDNWIKCAPLISILCLGYMWIPISNLNGNIIKSIGRSDISLKAEIIKKVMALGILAATLPFGLSILCWGVVLYNLIDDIIIISFSRRLLNIGFRKQIAAIFPILILGSAAALISYALMTFTNNDWAQITIGLISFATLYIAGAWLLRLNEIRLIISLLKKR